MLLFNKHNTDRHSQPVQSQKQYTCTGCSHQSESAIEQLKHAESSRHKPVMVTQKCFTCGNSFSGIEALMKHRREAHPSSKKCNFFPFSKITGEECFWKENCCYKHENEVVHTDDLWVCKFCSELFKVQAHLMHHTKTYHADNSSNCNKPNCHRNEQTCWYKHVKKDTVDTPNKNECSECDLKFNNYSAMMFHKKKNHYKMVNQCIASKCVRNDKACWYRHEGEKKSVKFQAGTAVKEVSPMEIDEGSVNSVFYKGRKIETPPDIMEIITELIKEQVAKLITAGPGRTH